MKTKLAALLATLAAAFLIGGAHPPKAQAYCYDCQHVVVIAMENHDLAELNSTNAPYITSLMNNYASFSNYQNLTHPSLPNYMAVTGGTTAGITTDCNPGTSCQSTATNVFKELQQDPNVADSWKAYEESMPTACDATNSSPYFVRHNPPVYYTDLASTCSARDIPLPSSNPSFASVLTWITPNICHDMHDTCGGNAITNGDNWLKNTMMPQIFNSTARKQSNLAVVIWWDEDDNTPHPLPMIVVSPDSTPGYVDTQSVDHYDMLGNILGTFGQSCIANSCNPTIFNANVGL